MVAPLVVLGAAAVLAGFLVNPVIDLGLIPSHALTDFLGEGPVHVIHESFSFSLASASTLMVISGISLAYLMYSLKCISPERTAERFRLAYLVLSRKYYLDEAFEGYLVTRYFYGGLARTTDWIDKWVVDRIANNIGWFGRTVGELIRQFQTGQLQGYGMALSAGIVVIFGIYLLFL
jgi:NADH-quinone oxidoreductase subunit L